MLWFTKRVTLNILMNGLARMLNRSKDGLNHFLITVLSRISLQEIIEQVLEFLEIKIMMFT